LSRFAVLTSGGDAPGMNAAVRAVVRRGLSKGYEIKGIQRGFAGLFNGSEFLDFNLGSVAGIIHRGGTMLLTARAEEMLQPEGPDRAAKRLFSEGVDGLVVIGGEGSFHGALALQDRGVKTICIPGTIDNDINETDSSIGFDTAVNTILDAINRLRDTATSHERIFLLEVMGRHTGYLALAAGLAGGAESILVPEIKWDLDDICRRLLQGIERQKTHSIIVVAEGTADVFEINKEIRRRIAVETRVTVLGHIQRGGSPSAVDRLLGSRMGAAAADLLIDGKSGLFTAVKGERIEAIPLEESFKNNKPFPKELYELILDLSR